MDIHRPSTPSPLLTTHDVPIRSAEIPVSVQRFSERLRHLPMGMWAELSERTGQTSVADARVAAHDANAGAVARRRLREVANSMPGAVVRVRGKILEMVACAEGFVRPDVIARMKKVALTAAIALTARPHLAPDEFDTLYEPFAGAIPLADLVVAPATPTEGDHAIVS
jgi:hypothetical protein